MNFAYNLSKALIAEDYKIISGFGKNIGSAIINGSLCEIMGSKYKHIDEYLMLRPFPQETFDPDLPKAELWTKYRESMINECGIAIFIFGNKDVNGEWALSNGMFEEFGIATKMGKKIIPVGSTGGSSHKIFCEIKNDISNYPYLESYIEKLEKETDPNKLIELIKTIIKQINN